MVTLDFYSPEGTVSVSVAHAPRLASLRCKRIALLSNDDWQSHRSMPLLKELLEHDFPGIEVLPAEAFPKGAGVMSQDSTIALVRASGADAVILGNAACGACSAACGAAAAKLEAQGIPTAILARTDFASVVRNTMSGSGLAPDIPMAEFPMDLFMPDSDLSPVRERREVLYAGLTTWSVEAVSADVPQIVSVEGRTYEEALVKANNLIMTSLWGDGLPSWPATKDRVEWILSGTDTPREQSFGRFPPRGAGVTVESCAIALAMAGGRPEYMPVLIAAVEALLDPDADSDQMQATSGAAFPVVIVNGPIAKQIRLNSGYGCLGPDPQYPAGASIGRALRQMQQNLGGALPGVGTMATWGAHRTTNLVFAEDDEGLPDGWLPHGSERHGFAAGTNSVSLFWATGATNVLRGSGAGQSLEQDLREGLYRVADLMSAPHIHHYCEGYEHGTPGAVLISRITARQLHAQGYYSKAPVRNFLWENSGISQSRMQRTGGSAWIPRSSSLAALRNKDLDPWPITADPGNITLIVAGGEHPMHTLWLPAFSRSVTGLVVHPPRELGKLLAQADRDLGCAADLCTIH